MSLKLTEYLLINPQQASATVSDTKSFKYTQNILNIPENNTPNDR